MRLEGKVAIVTGSTRGIGRSTAAMMAHEGAKVAVTGRTVEKGQKVVQLIRDVGGEAEFFPLDITIEESKRDTIEAAAAKGGINSITATLAVETAPPNIWVNTIVVGRVIAHKADTGVGVGGGHLTRLGVPDDIAYAITWLASDESAFVTGSIVTADGGFTVNGDAVMAAG